MTKFRAVDPPGHKEYIKKRLKFREETTEWDNPAILNHTYVFENKELVGYIKKGTKKVIWMDKPSRQWSPRGRTFRYLKDSEVNELILGKEHD